MGEEAGQEVGALPDAFESVADDGSEVANAVDGEVAFDVGPHGLGGVEVWALGGQLHDVQPVPAGDQVAHHGAEVHVAVVSDDHDGGFEVLMCGIQQGGVVGGGEAAPFSFAGTVHLDPVEQPAPVAWLDADESGHGDAAGSLPRHRDHRCTSARRPGPRLGRPKLVTRRVLEADPRPTFGR